MLTIAVLSIIVTAPIGALAIAISGPRFLKSTGTESISSTKDQDTVQENLSDAVEGEEEKAGLPENSDFVTHI